MPHQVAAGSAGFAGGVAHKIPTPPAADRRDHPAEARRLPWRSTTPSTPPPTANQLPLQPAPTGTHVRPPTLPQHRTPNVAPVAAGEVAPESKSVVGLLDPLLGFGARVTLSTEMVPGADMPAREISSSSLEHRGGETPLRTEVNRAGKLPGARVTGRGVAVCRHDHRLQRLRFRNRGIAPRRGGSITNAGHGGRRAFHVHLRDGLRG